MTAAVKALAPIRKYAGGNHAATACQRWGKRTCLTFAGNTTAVRLEERAGGHSWGAWELGFLGLSYRENFGSGLGVNRKTLSGILNGQLRGRIREKARGESDSSSARCAIPFSFAFASLNMRDDPSWLRGNGSARVLP